MDPRPRAVEQVRRLAERLRTSPSQAASQAAARAGKMVRSALPGAAGAAPADAATAATNATPFGRALSTAMASRPHARGLSTALKGSTFIFSGFRAPRREHRKLRDQGFDAAAAPELGLLDLDELVHVHGRRLPSLMEMSSLNRSGRQTIASFTGNATGSLHAVTVSEEDRARGALDWTRLCVDTDQSATLFDIVEDTHLDILIAAPGRDRAEHAADLALLLPQGLPPQVIQALGRDPRRPTARLHLLGKGRVAVDHGASTVIPFSKVPHSLRGSLVVVGGRITRAELWVATRHNVLPWVLGGLMEAGG
ncbi:hypothetical protein [Actinomyces oricola]|uniref:hypothetical protein n=1 Tax=Actinomyces oricola TaxID=206043 RepID=UPI001F4FFA8C|nr:hypothetical protein [Actinomyces oricola]